MVKHYQSVGSEDSLQVLAEIADEKIVIWHWDAIPKPWEKASSRKGWEVHNPKSLSGYEPYEADGFWINELIEIEQAIGGEVNRTIETKGDTSETYVKLTFIAQNDALFVDGWNSIIVDESPFTGVLPDQWLIMAFMPAGAEVPEMPEEVVISKKAMRGKPPLPSSYPCSSLPPPPTPLTMPLFHSQDTTQDPSAFKYNSE